MRIISGKYKGKRIRAPKYLTARPTTDMAKEALFNILHNTFDFEDCSVLDLYTGTGNISYEFASRGAPDIFSVDQDARAVSFVGKTAKTMSFPIKVMKSDALSYLKKTRDQFDIIFADPPYAMDDQHFAQIAEIVFKRELLKPNGLLIIEHSKHTDLSGLAFLKDSRRYGGSVFSFFGE